MYDLDEVEKGDDDLDALPDFMKHDDKEKETGDDE
jgi:hypothetical protein